MKTVKTFILSALMGMSATALADGIRIEPFTLTYGTPLDVAILLDNNDNYGGLQFDLYLPQGVKVLEDEYGPYYEITSRLQYKNGRTTENFTHSVDRLANGAYRFLIFNSAGQNIAGMSGEAIMTVRLEATDQLTTGENVITVKEQVLSTVGATRYPISDATFKCTLALRTTIRPLGYATFSWPRRVDFRGAEGLTAWIVTEVGDGSVKMEQVEKVEEGTAVVLQGAEGTYELNTFPDDGICDDTEGNKLTGTANGPYTVEGDGVFVLSNKTDGIAGFYPAATGLEIAQYKAYLNKSDAPLGVRFFAFDGTASGISTANAEVADDYCYDLMGRRVGSQGTLRKGLYIRNRKVITVK